MMTASSRAISPSRTILPIASDIRRCFGRRANGPSWRSLAVGSGSWDWDISTGKVVYDARWAEMLGESIDQLTMDLESWESRVHPDDLPIAKAAVQSHLEDDTSSLRFEIRMRHSSGTWRWILSSGRVVARDDAGNPLRMVGTHLDVTDRVAAVQQAQQLASILKDAPAEVYLFDAETLQFVEVNGSAL